MTALAANRQTTSKECELKGYPVAASTKIYKGSLVNINASGYAVPAADTAGHLGCVGVAEEYVDNSSGANAAKYVRVRSGRAFLFNASSITQAMLYTKMYVVDDNTFDDAAGPTNDIACGFLIEYVSATSGWIFIPEGGAYTASWVS